jgi:hypothetical protein
MSAAAVKSNDGLKNMTAAHAIGLAARSLIYRRRTVMVAGNFNVA